MGLAWVFRVWKQVGRAVPRVGEGVFLLQPTDTRGSAFLIVS